MNASLPPSSIVDFLSAWPSCPATIAPAASLPVSATPLILGAAVLIP